MNTARYWTHLTSVICKINEPLENDLPDNKYFLHYGPGYELSILRKHLDDLNTENDLENVFQTISGMLLCSLFNYYQVVLCMLWFNARNYLFQKI